MRDAVMQISDTIDQDMSKRGIRVRVFKLQQSPYRSHNYLGPAARGRTSSLLTLGKGTNYYSGRRFSHMGKRNTDPDGTKFV